MNRLLRYLQQNLWHLATMTVIIPLGFCTKFYAGPWEHWVNNSLGGVLYVIFWSLLLCLLLPRINRWKVTVAVFMITCALEFLQLWHPDFLEWVRSSFIGATLIGNSFVWSDLLYYLFGFLSSLGILQLLHGSRKN